MIDEKKRNPVIVSGIKPATFDPNLSIQVNAQKGLVWINFGRQVNSVGFRPADAEALAKALFANARTARLLL